MSRAKSRRLVAAFAVSMCVSAGAYAAPTIADFSAHADAIRPAISPDGNLVAFVTRAEDNRILMVVDLVKRERRALMGAIVESFEISSCGFKNDERLLCGFRGTQFFRGQPYIVSAPGRGRRVGKDQAPGADPERHRGRLAVPGPRARLAAQRSQARVDPAVRRRRSVSNGAFARCVHRAHLRRAALALLDHELDGRPARRGALRLRVRRQEAFIHRARFGRRLRGARSPSGKSASPISRWSDLAPRRRPCWSRPIHNGRDAIFEMDLDEKSDRQLLFSNSEVDVGGPIYWPSDNRIIGFEYETDRTHRKFFDAEAEAIYAAIDRAAAGFRQRGGRLLARWQASAGGVACGYAPDRVSHPRSEHQQAAARGQCEPGASPRRCRR